MPFHRKQSLLGPWKGGKKNPLCVPIILLFLNTFMNYIQQKQTFFSCVLLQAKLSKDLTGCCHLQTPSWIRSEIGFYNVTQSWSNPSKSIHTNQKLIRPICKTQTYYFAMTFNWQTLISSRYLSGNELTYLRNQLFSITKILNDFRFRAKGTEQS